MPTLSALPSTLLAGDSYTITLTLDGYAASAGWAVTWTVAGPSTGAWVSTASGDAHVLTLSSASTAALDAGDYQTSLKATKAGTVDTLVRGTLVVEADLATMSAGENVSYWVTLKAAAEGALQQMMAGGGVQMAMILGRQMMFQSADQCLRVIAQCEQRIAMQRSGTFGRPARFDVVGFR